MHRICASYPDYRTCNGQQAHTALHSEVAVWAVVLSQMKGLTMKVSIIMMIRRSGSLPWPAQKQCCASHAVLMKALAMIMSMRRSGSHMGRVQFWKCCATMA